MDLEKLIQMIWKDHDYGRYPDTREVSLVSQSNPESGCTIRRRG